MAGQEWTTSALGGNLTSETLSRNVRHKAQPKMRFRQLVRPELALGAHNGDYVTFRKFGELEDEGREIGEKEPVPETQFRTSTGQVQVGELSNSVPYTWRVSLLSKLSVEDMIIINLMNDMAKVIDKKCANVFRTADLVYTPIGTTSNKQRVMATNGTAGDTATRPISAWDVKNILDDMRSEYNMPAFDGNDYLCIASTSFLRSLKDDNEVVEAMKFGSPQKLFSGEVGRYYGCRFIEENHVLNNSLAGGLGEAIFIAWDAVIEAVTYAEEIQAKVGDEYGRDRGFRWVWMGGFAKTWDFSTDGEARLVRVYSL